jgi:hypothetical protein
MTGISISAFKDVGEAMEIHWLTGLTRGADGGWLVRAVSRGLNTNEIKMWSLPIGLLTFLTPGLRFDGGRLLPTQPLGQVQSAHIANVKEGEELTTAQLPAGIYPFYGHRVGVQRLLRYASSAGDLYIPTIEMVRFLLVHNKALANALMVPGQLMTLYQFETPGQHDELTLRFTNDVPVRCLSNRFALEFAWLAVHPEGRRTWDSVYTRSAGEEYVSLDLPDIPESHWIFRGIPYGGAWLVLELIHLSGRSPPCSRLYYSHPAMKRPKDVSLVTQGTDGDGGNKGGERTEKLFEIKIAGEGTKSNASQSALDAPAKSATFTADVPVEKIWGIGKTATRQLRDSKQSENSGHGPPTKKFRVVHVGADRECMGAQLPPIEFRTLQVHPWELAGELQALADTIQIMATLVEDCKISMSLCQLKPGRAFSIAGRLPRSCLVAHISVSGRPPIVLLDVDRTGERALSTMALHFLDFLSYAKLETYVQSVLNHLVGRGGHWDSHLEKELTHICICERLPKILPLRGAHNDSSYHQKWAWRLANKLVLPLKMGD